MSIATYAKMDFLLIITILVKTVHNRSLTVNFVHIMCPFKIFNALSAT